MPNSQPINLRQAQAIILTQLSQVSANISTETTLVLAYVLGLPAKDLFSLSTEHLLTPHQVVTLEDLISRRLNHEPLERITKRTEFYGLELKVCDNTLIPRPETEGLVDLVVNYVKTLPSNTPLRILEVGLGTGCICTAICDQIRKLDRSFAYQGIDINIDAINCTEFNLNHQNLGMKSLRNLNSTVELKHVDAFSEFALNLGQFDIIVSNPPYLTESEMDELSTSVKEFDPANALDGGKEGIKFYERILEIVTEKEELPAIFLEISPATAAKVAEIFGRKYPTAKIELDLFGRERYLIATI